MGGAGGGGDGNPNGSNQPLGTEYTLQGVMRFLQSEWHRHERDRNAWEIERAEMKARIAKLEGENRSGKKMQDSFSKHIQMLENALKKEREIIKAMSRQVGSEETDKDQVKGDSQEAKLTKPPNKHHNSFLDVASEAPSPYRQDAHRQKSRIYLEKSLQEITYLLTPPAHPTQPPQHATGPPQDLTGAHGYSGQQLAGQTLEDVYMQHRQQNHQQLGGGMNKPGPSSNFQTGHGSMGSDMSNSSSMNHAQQAAHMSRSLGDQQPLPQTAPLSFNDHTTSRQTHSGLQFPSSSDEAVEKVVHSYDSYGRPITNQEENLDMGAAHRAQEESANNEPDGWTFDEPSQTIPPEAELKIRNPDTDLFPDANHIPSKSPPRSGPASHRRKGSMSRRRSDEAYGSSPAQSHLKADSAQFKVRFALRGHLDVVRAVIFTGGGSPSEPEICTTGDDGTIKRWIIPANYTSAASQVPSSGNDLDITSYFTHRGHTGAVTALAACPSSLNFSTGGRATGDGWIFSGGHDATLRVWERGRVDPKATLDGHTDTVWSVCVLPSSSSSVFGGESGGMSGPDRVFLASGAADGTIKIWTVSAPPQLSSTHSGSRRGVGGRRRESVTSGSGFPSSPQPSTASATPFHYSLVHTISRSDTTASPTCIAPLSVAGDRFVVSFTDASILIFDTRTAEEIVGMASLETYDGTPATGVNSVVATSVGLEGSVSLDSTRGLSEDETMVHGATGSSGVEGVVISGHEDRYIRFFDANSGQCTYTMLAHPSAISSLSLSPDGRELVSAGHDASLRFWSLEKRSCTQEITSHRLMRSEGVCAVVWSQDGRWVVSGGGDGVVKVFAR
ncbi:MAG: hypothetical protein M1833_003361 [Piccolia ochrophora]|nr:MAG: hypothetical protein M1833_003361 [Piccolia ochrophora]